MEKLKLISHPSTDNRRRKDLPPDVTRDIFFRLPIRSLLRFKCVCKFWYDLITSSDFIVNYNKDDDKGENKFSIFCHSNVCDDTSTTVSFQFFDVPVDLTIPVAIDHVNVVGSSNGLVCLSFTIWREGFIIWNPVTKQFRQIDGHYPPSYKRGYYSCGFCFDPVADTFKVARIGISDDEVQINMFKGNSWRLQELTLPLQTSHSMRNTVCVDTYMYWDAVVNYGKGKGILCYDMVDELFGLIPLPYSDIHFTRLAGYKDTIALFVRERDSSNYFDVWVMNDRQGTSKSSWSKQITCRPSVTVVFAEGFLCKDETNLVVTSNYWFEQFSWDPETCETKNLPGVKAGGLKFDLYSESFASVY